MKRQPRAGVVAIACVPVLIATGFSLSGSGSLGTSMILSAQVAPPPQPAPLTQPPKPVTTNLGGRESPPQPHQQQSLDYFVGSWSYSWNGRESGLSGGPRSGTTVFSRSPSDRAVLQIRTEGTLDDGGSYKETGTMAWNPERKQLTFNETLANGVALISTGDWSSPIAIRVDGQPVRAGGQMLRLRRTINVVSATSFSVIDELSTDNGEFVRLGTGTFRKLSTPR